MKAILLPVLLSLLSFGILANDFKKGMAAYDKGNYTSAFFLWKPLAQQGSVSAQFNLGVMYITGKGVPKDNKQAIQWFRQAAQQGHITAQSNLSVIYKQGLGIPNDDKRATQWFPKPALQDVPRAKLTKLQSPPSISQANNNTNISDIKLATLILSIVLIGIVFFRKVKVNVKPVEPQDKNKASSQYEGGIRYRKGKGVTKDYKKAIIWFEKAAKQNHVGAQFQLGIMYRNGEGTSQDYNKALMWFTKAAEQNHLDSIFFLGLMHCNGEGTSQDYNKALIWFTKAADQGRPESQYYVRMMSCDRKSNIKPAKPSIDFDNKPKRRTDNDLEIPYRELTKKLRGYEQIEYRPKNGGQTKFEEYDKEDQEKLRIGIEKKHTNLINSLENKLILLDKKYQEKCHDNEEIESSYITLKSNVETIKNNFKGEEYKLKKEVINLQNHLNNVEKKLKSEIFNLKKVINTKQSHLENCWKTISKYEKKERKIKNTLNSSVIEPNFNFCNACDRSIEYCICAK